LQSRPFPTLGITLTGILEFVEQCGGRERLEGLTTTQVCHNIMKPMTEASGLAYCDHLKMQATSSEIPCEVIGKANVFISHAWQYRFLDVVDTLLLHFDHKVRSHSTDHQNLNCFT
jgi:hypothetical protein